MTTEAAEAVLFIHSTGTGPLLWSTVPQATVGESRQMILPANLGYPPNAPIERGTPVTAADDAAKVVLSVPAEIERVHIVAHSYGALVGLKALPLLKERVASLFFYEPVVFGALAAERSPQSEEETQAIAQAKEFLEHPWFLTDEERGGREEWTEMFIDYWNRPGSWKKMPEPVRQFTLSVGWKMFQEVRACFYDQTPFEEWKIDAPMTIMRGDRSPVGSRAMAKALVRGRPNATLIEGKGIGHMAPLTHPGVIHAELTRHLASGGGAST